MYTINLHVHCILVCLPSSETQGQSVRSGEKTGWRWKSPWVPTLTGPFPKIQADAGSWLGTKNGLYYCAQSVNTSPEFFSSVHTRWLLSHHTCTVRSPSLQCVQGKLLFSTFLTRHKGTTDESKKRLECYQQEQFFFYWIFSFMTLPSWCRTLSVPSDAYTRLSWCVLWDMFVSALFT